MLIFTMIFYYDKIYIMTELREYEVRNNSFGIFDPDIIYMIPKQHGTIRGYHSYR